MKNSFMCNCSAGRIHLCHNGQSTVGSNVPIGGPQCHVTSSVETRVILRHHSSGHVKGDFDVVRHQGHLGVVHVAVEGIEAGDLAVEVLPWQVPVHTPNPSRICH